MLNKNINSMMGGGARYGALDGLRVLACIGIVLMHVMVNNSVKPSANFFITNVVSFTGNFVLLFMMVSAYSLSCGYYNRFRDGNISMNDFYRKRYVRILPFFSLLVIIDIIQTFFSENFSLTNSMLAASCEAYADLTLVFGLLPDAKITVIGVGWFLGIIFLFYMLYPFFTFLIYNKKRAWTTLFLSVILYFIVEVYFVPTKGVVFNSKNILYCAPYFIAGGLIFLYRRDIAMWSSRRYMRIQNHKWLLLLVVGYTIIFFAYPSYRIHLFSNLLLYALWLLYAVAESSSSQGYSFLNNKFMAFLSNISMEIYLCHMMFFRVVEKAHLERHINNDDWNYWLTCLLALIGAVAFSLAWKWAEKKFCNINISWLSARQH